jgi:tRNA dimethylallyltransferase
MPKILIICGPTATGKTALAQKLANRFKGTLISADSRQIYKGMDIGTGKDLKGVYGYDLIDPDESYSLANYREFALGAIDSVQGKGRLPILVGGTGLYLKSIFNPPETANIKPNPQLRAELENLSTPDLQAKMQALSRDRFNQMNRSDQLNPRRLIRAIEVCSEKSLTSIQSLSSSISTFDSLWICLFAPIEIIDEKIASRVRERATPAFTQEVKKILARFPKFFNYPSASATGYREWLEFIQQKITKEEAITEWILRERQYARRQLTWFKKQPNLQWFDVSKSGFEVQVARLIENW